LKRRHWWRDEAYILVAQTNLASCLDDVGRGQEALILMREIYARRIASYGLAHEHTIQTGSNLIVTMFRLGLYDEGKTLLRDQLVPAARRLLGYDHDTTLDLNKNLANAIQEDPKRSRDNRRLNQRDARRRDLFNLDTGDDLLEAETILLEVVKRRRRVFGPTHPDTLLSERDLSNARVKLATRMHA